MTVFPCCYLDLPECTQAIEPASLCPIVRGAEQVVLLGDHFQLPPTVLSQKSKDAGLSKSLFERLVEIGIEPVLLQNQYR